MKLFYKDVFEATEARYCFFEIGPIEAIVYFELQ